jgi:GTP-binding protein LepA
MLMLLSSYGGDATRTREHGQRGALFERSAEAAGEAEGGEKRMREYGSVSIPQEGFIAALRMGDEG